MASTNFDPARHKRSTRDQWQAAAAAWRRWEPAVGSVEFRDALVFTVPGGVRFAGGRRAR